MMFADSSYFIALARERDRWHGNALKLAEKIKEPLLVSDLVISESITLVGSLEGGKAGKILYEFFTDSCKVEFMDSEMLANAMETFVMYDGSISLADAASVEIMKKYGIKKIVSFDNDFDRVKEIERVY